MKPCTECNRNKWKFSMAGDVTVATCTGCGNQLRWKKKNPKGIGAHCPECGVKMDRIEIPFNVSVFEKREYYTHKYKCGKCGLEYDDVLSKRINAFIKT